MTHAVPLATIELTPGSATSRRSSSDLHRPAPGSRRVARLLIAACVLLSAGCQLPDVTPFVDATSGLKSAVAAAGSSASTELATIDPKSAEKLAQAWKTRDAAMMAMSRYASTLQDLVDAGNNGADAAAKVADGIKGLADAAGIPLPGSAAAIGVVTDTGKFIAGQIARAAAAGSLTKALEEGQPALTAIVEKLKLDLADLDTIVRAAKSQQEAGLNDIDPNAREFQTSALKAIDGLPASNRIAETSQYKTALDVANDRVNADLARRKTLDDRIVTQRQLIAATNQALEAWADAHKSLIAAAKAKRMVSVASLVEATTEIRDLVKRMREL